VGHVPVGGEWGLTQRIEQVCDSKLLLRCVVWQQHIMRQHSTPAALPVGHVQVGGEWGLTRKIKRVCERKLLLKCVVWQQQNMRQA
jgi:ribosomal protein L4